MDTTSPPIMIAGNDEPIHEEVIETIVKNTAVQSATHDGTRTQIVRVESGFTRGFAGIQIIGHAGETCRDGKERVRAAMERIGHRFPGRRMILSMTPADVKKEGCQFDLAMAISLGSLLLEQELAGTKKGYLFAAEVGLTGELRPVKGIVAIAVHAMAQKMRGVVMARENLRETAQLKALSKQTGELDLIGFERLEDVLDWVFASKPAKAVRANHVPGPELNPCKLNFDDMVLSPKQRLLAQTIATGGHSVLLHGPPGTGKSMFAARLGSLMPAMAPKQHIEAMTIHSSVRERLDDEMLAGRPPYRSPHHSASMAALTGRPDKPGELSLAHGGILFLDELPEFRRDLMESLREPLESGTVRIARAAGGGVWNCRILLVAAANACPCGWYGSHKRECHCTTKQILAYGRRISGPIRDRIDLHFNMPERADAGAALFVEEQAPDVLTAAMSERVLRAREFGRDRNEALGIDWNRDIPAPQLLAALGWSAAEFRQKFMKTAPKGASHRSTTRALRVARSLADLDQIASIQLTHWKQAWEWQDEAASTERGTTLPRC